MIRISSPVVRVVRVVPVARVINVAVVSILFLVLWATASVAQVGGDSLTGNDVAYGYDELNRLVRVVSQTSDVTFSYDAAGNRTQVLVPEPGGAAPLALSILLLAICGTRRRQAGRHSLRRGLRSAAVLLAFLTVCLTVADPAHAQNLPGFSMPTMADPSLYFAGAPTAFAASSSSSATVTHPGSSTEITPEIQELARALNNNVDLIYEYVYSQIEFNPIWGSHKGATGTLIDGEGNDFDQASLMIALLRESGYTASFVYGQVNFVAADAINWLGIADSGNVMASLLSNSGRDPARSQITVFPDGRLFSVDMERVWVKVDINGTDYVFDPAFKSRTVTTGINVGAAMVYNRSGFLSGALSGATITSNSVQNLNDTSIDSSLTGYASNLATEIKTNYPGATLDDIIGGATINPLSTFPRDTTLPGQNTIYEEWAIDISSTYRACLRITLPGIDETFNTDSIVGKRLTIFYESNQPVLRLNGLVIATGTTVIAGSSQSLGIEANHPFAGGFGDQSGTMFIEAGGSYLVLNGWTGTREGMVRLHERRERENTFNGGTLLSEPVLGEALAVFATSWQAQVTEACELAGKLASAHCFAYHRIGVAGQNASPYVDIPFSSLGVTSNADDAVVAGSVFFSTTGHSSVLEGGVIEQIQPQARAVSTVELAGIANDQPTTFFDATMANFATIQPQLINYNASELASVQSFLDAGARVIIPQNGNLTLDNWTGVGFLSVNDLPVGRSLGYIISGGLNGGFGTTDFDLDVFTNFQPQPVSHNQSSDPIDLVTGDFLFDGTDLTIGSQPYPYGLAFKRTYNSGSRYNDGPVGLGWTHNFDMRALPASDGFEGFGNDSPVDAVAAIVEMLVSLDLLSGSETASELIIAMLTQRWFMGQLIDNVVTVSEPGNTSLFVKLPDGTYNPPPGSASELTVLPAGNFQLETKHGLRFVFRNDGALDFSIDPNGNVVSFSYSSGVLQNVTDAAGHVLSFTYSGDRISSVSDGTRSFGYGYDTAGNLTTVTDANSESTTFQYQSDGLLNRVSTPANPTNARVFNTFNSLGHVETQLDALGNLYTYYITGGSRSQEVDPAFNTTITYYDDQGKIRLDVDGAGFLAAFDYDGEGRLIARSQSEGNFVQFEYDDLHNLTKEISYPKPGSAQPPIVREFTYDPVYNKIETSTDPRLNVTSFSYDANGNLQTITQPLVAGQTPITTLTYNSRGQVLTTTDPEGTITSFAYDPITADLLSTTADSGAGGFALVTSMTYNAAGDRITQTDPRLNTVIFDYDNMRRVAQTTSPAPFNFITTITNDEDGNVTEVSRETGDVLVPWQTTTTAYTLSGKVSTVTDPDLGVTLTEYDARDRISRVTDAEGQLTQIFYDARGNLDHSIDAKGVTSQQYTYMPNGQVSSVADANGNTTGYRYDGFDRLEFTDFQNSDFEQLTYDAASNVVDKRTRSGPSITYTYDELNRLATKSPFAVPSVTYDYDLAGRLLVVTDSAGLTSYGYDALGRRISVIHPRGELLGYEYDASGNRSLLRYPDNYFVTFEYDEMNRLQRIADPATTSIAFFTYDALSRLVTTNRISNATTTYTYEIDNDVESVSHLFNGGITADFSYSYNAIHNRKFTSVSEPQFVFNSLAPQESNYTTNNMNQATAVVFEPQGAGQGVGYQLGYDLNGNQTSSLNPNSYTHNIENRLIHATTPNDSLDFSYDASGLRTSKTVDGVVTNYILDGNQVVADYNDVGQMLRRYVYAGLDRPIQMTTSTGTYYYHTDALGSVIALSDAGANRVETYAYSPYGQVDQPSSLGNPILYAGREYDPEVGLYYYRNRYYEPELGRFLEPDLIGFGDGLNLYAYVGGNPVNLVDPLGLFATGPRSGRLESNLSSPLPAQQRQETLQNVFGGASFATGTTSGAIATAMFLFPEIGSSAIGGTLLLIRNGTGMASVGLAAVDFGARTFPVPGAEASGQFGSGAGLGAGLGGLGTAGTRTTLFGITGFALGVLGALDNGSPPSVSIRNEVRQRELGN